MERLIIFDMDGTLYKLDAVIAAVYEIQIDFLRMKKNVTRDEAISYFEDNYVFPFVSEKSRSATRLFQEMGFDLQEWNTYRESRFPLEAIDANSAVSESILDGFRKLGTCVLVTSNSWKNANRVLEKIGIRGNVFDQIICNDATISERPFSKGDIFRNLLDRYSAQPDLAVSIGDRYATDIEPMLSLGGRGILVAAPDSLYRVMKDFSIGKLKTCESYRFFPSREATKLGEGGGLG